MTKISKDVSLYYALLCVENNKQCLILGIKNKYYNSTDNIWLRLFSKKGKVQDRIRGDLINLNYSGLLEFKFILSTKVTCIHFNIECIYGERKKQKVSELGSKSTNGWILLYKDKYCYVIDSDNDCYLNAKIHCMAINPLQYTKYALVLSNSNNINKCLEYYQGIKKVINNNNNDTNKVKKFVVLFENNLKIYPYVFKKCKQCCDTGDTNCYECNCCLSLSPCPPCQPIEIPFIPCGTNIVVDIPNQKCIIYELSVMARYRDNNDSEIGDMKKITYFTLDDTTKELTRKEYLCPLINSKTMIKDILFSINAVTDVVDIKIILNESIEPDITEIALSYRNIIISGQ